MCGGDVMWIVIRQLADKTPHAEASSLQIRVEAL